MRGCKDAIREAPLCKLLGLCWRSWQPSVRRLVFAWIWLAGNSPLWCRKHCVSKCQQAVRCCVLFPAPHFASLVQHGDCFLMLWKHVHSSLFEMESPSSNEDSDAIQRGIGLLWRRQLPTGDWPQENIAGVSGSQVALLSDRVSAL